MTEYQEDARVEVYDPDRGQWCTGTVQGIAQTSLGSVLMVKSDHEVEYDLPLMWAVPARAIDELVRPIPADRPHVPVDCWCGRSRGIHD